MPLVIVAYFTPNQDKDPIIKWIERQNYTCVSPGFYLIDSEKLDASDIWKKLELLVPSDKSLAVLPCQTKELFAQTDKYSGTWVSTKFSYLDLVPVKPKETS